MYMFDSLGDFVSHGRRGFYVQNIQRCFDFKWLIGEIVTVNGSKYKVTEIKRGHHGPPWKAGEEITLMVD